MISANLILPEGSDVNNIIFYVYMLNRQGSVGMLLYSTRQYYAIWEMDSYI